MDAFDTTSAGLLLKNGNPRDAAQAIADWPAPEIASFIGQAHPSEQVALIRALPRETATAALAHLEPGAQRAIVKSVTADEAQRLMQSMETDDITHLLEDIPEKERSGFLDLLLAKDRQAVTVALSYPVESVGRLTSPDVAAVSEDWTVGQALAHIRNEAPPPELIANVHVIDSESRLVDTLELSRFVLADPATRVKQIMDRRYVALSPLDDREKAVQLIQKFDLPSIPVVDERGVLLGVVTVDDVLDVAEEEATEDIQRQAAMAPLKAAYPQLGILALFLKRIPWVAGLMLVYMLASGIVSRFEETLAAQLVLASFIPLLMGSAGNVGSQAGTLTVRAIATGVLPRKLWMKAAAKETAVGAGLAVTLGLLASLIAYVQAGPGVALVVGVAMAIVVIVANFFGLILPLILVSMGADPAVAASPFITSLTDITSLMIYFAVASSFLGVS